MGAGTGSSSLRGPSWVAMGSGFQRSGGSPGRRAPQACRQLFLLGLLLSLALVLSAAQGHSEEPAQGHTAWDTGRESDELHEYGDDGAAHGGVWEHGEGIEEFFETSGDYDPAGDEHYSQGESQWEGDDGGPGRSAPSSAFRSAEEIAEEMELRRDEEERAGYAPPQRSPPRRQPRELSSPREEAEDDDGILFVDDLRGIWVEAMGAALAVSLCSILCLFLLPLLSHKGKVTRPVVDMLAAFGVGAMLGDAFLHQLPHAFSAHSGANNHSHGTGPAEAHAEHRHGGGVASDGPGHAHSAEDLAVGIAVLVGVVVFFLVEKLVRWVEEQAGAEEEEAAAQRALAEKVAQVKKQREAAARESGREEGGPKRAGEGAAQGEALLSAPAQGAEAGETQKGRQTKAEAPAEEEEAPGSDEDNGWEPLEGPQVAPASWAEGASGEGSKEGTNAAATETKAVLPQGKGAAGAAPKDGKGAVRRRGAAGARSEGTESVGPKGSAGAAVEGNGGTNAEESPAPVPGNPSWASPGVPSASSAVVGYLNLFSDAIHNFTDGLSLGSAFLHRGSLGGYSRMLFMLAHEIPQEIGDFGILVRSGMAVLQALALNFVSALMAVAGTAVALSLGADPGNSSLVEGFTAGGFIYISLAGVLPDMQAHKPGAGLALLHTLALCAGMATALAICMIE